MTPVFVWVLLTLAVYRAIRFIAFDDFPPMAATRDYLTAKMGDKWGVLVECPWCLSMYLVPVAYLVAVQFVSIPLPFLQAVATMTVCGLVGNHDS